MRIMGTSAAVAAVALLAGGCGGKPAQGSANAAAGGAEAAASAPAVGASIPTGDYECWANGEARMLLNFTVTGPGQYRASDGSSNSFSYDGTSGRIEFSGYLKESLPDGWTTIYHAPQGKPTVSFRSDRGDEASFCEHV